MPDLLLDIPENPRPEWAEGGTFVARDGKTIRYGLFPARGRPLKGTVVILTGRNESIEKYYETVRDLSVRGLGVAVMDWRGQGGSDRMLRDRMRGYVRNFDQYVSDLEQFFSDVVLPDCRGPIYVLGHSMGGLIALLAAPKLFNRVRRMVLIAPLLDLVGQPVSTPTLRRLATLFSWLGLGRLYASGGPRPVGGYPFSGNKVTSDLRRYTRNVAIYDQAPHLAMGSPTIRWIHEASKAADRVRDPDFIGRIHIPTLIVAAGADAVVSTPAIEDLVRRMRSGALLTIDGAQHEIIQEADVYREQFLAAFDAFIPGENAEY